MFSRRLWRSAVPLAVATMALAGAGAGSAEAQTGNPFGCSATTAAASLAGVNLLPGATSANGSSSVCASAASTLNLTTVPLSAGLLSLGSLSVGPASAQTVLTTGQVNGATVDLGATATSTVDALNLNLASVLTVGITTPSQAKVDYECVNDQLVPTASSTLNAITIDGNTISLNGLPQDLSIPGVATILVNQHTSTGTSDTETLLQVQLLGLVANGLTIDAGQAQASMPQTGGCTGTTPTPTPNPTPNPNPPGPTPNPTPNPNPTPGPVNGCPVGTTVDASTGTCVLSGSGGPIQVVSQNSGDIVGGSVISLTEARHLYPKAHCLRGAGPAYVVVGTKGKNKITVKSKRFRVLGLGGNDTITVKSGQGTCVDGGAGKDRLVNKGTNRVSLYGSAGADRILLGNGQATVRGGSGNDVITAGNGTVTVFGGVGNDVITAGTGHDIISGGSGRNRITARGKWAHVSAGHGNSVAYVTAANRAYARHHGVAHVHVLT